MSAAHGLFAALTVHERNVDKIIQKHKYDTNLIKKQRWNKSIKVIKWIIKSMDRR